MLISGLLADQATKLWATRSLFPLGSVTLIPGFFNLTYVQNAGVAFGMFAGQGLIIGLFVAVFVGVALFYTRTLNWTGWEPNAIGGALCGGALGNLLDRVRLGHVVDFLDVHWGPHRWPTFNVADSLICLAVAWIVVRQLGPARG